MTYQQWLRWRACDRKQQWPSETVAANYSTLLRWRHGKEFETYECRYCGGWHVATAREAA